MQAIGEILEELRDEPEMQVYAWRLHCLEQAGFNVGPAVLIARERMADLRKALRMHSQGCPDTLVAHILT